ncbi:TPA: hypothetical protein N2N71_003458 [Enterobacter hormaechei]|nr:hypothetical protein [Enterobacter hormaechei]
MQEEKPQCFGMERSVCRMALRLSGLRAHVGPVSVAPPGRVKPTIDFDSINAPIPHSPGLRALVAMIRERGIIPG